MKINDGFEVILRRLPVEVSEDIAGLPQDILLKLEEIRIVAGHPILIYADNKEYCLGKTRDHTFVDNVFRSMTDYSEYAYQEELSKGYITIEGGHRIGVCGRTIYNDGQVLSIKDISSLNIRKCREIPGISDWLIPYVLDSEGRFLHTLIISPPRCGKTTLLRDMIRNLSIMGFRIALCDERSEVAGSFLGSSGFDLGPRTDVLDGCPKEVGMVMLIRSMAPDILATDEVGKTEDIYGIENTLSAGVGLLTTIHGLDYKNVLSSRIGYLVKNGVFKRLIYLSGKPCTGTISAICDSDNHKLF